MVWQETPYAVPLLATAAFLVGFGAYLRSLNRNGWTSGTSLGGLLLVAGGIWVGSYALRLSAATLPGKLLWIRVEFLPVLALPVLWLAYVVRYTGRTDWLTWRVFGPLTAIAAAIELLVLTDGVHHLFYREYGLAQVGAFAVFDPVYGPAFAVYLGFVYTLLGASLLFLATAAVHARGVFRWQISALFLVPTVPGVTGLLDVTGNNPLPGLNLAALSVVVSTAAVVVSFARFRWTEMTPIARDQAFEAMTEAVVVLDAEARIIDLNAAAERILPDSEGSPVGEPAIAAFPELAEALDGVDGAADTRTELTVSDDGERRYLDVRVSAVDGSAGDPAGYTVILHDVTARRAAEERAEERRRKIEKLHGIARDLTAARTRAEVFQRAVEGGEEVLDADVCRLAVEEDERLVPAANSGDEPADQYDPQPADRGIAGVTFQSGVPVVVDDLADARDVAAAPEPDSGPYLADGDPVHRALLSAPVGDIGAVQALATEPGAFTDGDREVLELLATHIETAAQRAEAESELRTERDRLEEFASVISHDLRNPLNVAQGRIELLKREIRSDHVEPIERSLSRMEEIVTDILTLAREGESVGDLETVDLGGVLDDAWATVDTGSAVLRYPDDIGTVEADRGRLRQLFENLFRNAVEHGSRSDPHGNSIERGSTGSRSDPHGNSIERGSTGSRSNTHENSAERGPTDSDSEPGPTGADGQSDPAVTVRVGRIDDGAGFYVADDGPGIPPEERDAVFEHGYTTRSDGTGLGLTIVDRIADAHGWTVAVTESDAGGARFEVRTDG